MASIEHHFTVDVEEYFQVSALEPYVAHSDWNAQESRVESSVDVLLEILDQRNATGTFFILGWIAERHPEMIKRIADCGHEIASHGWDHRRVTKLEPDQFRESVRRSKTLLEDLSGNPVLGFRAPSFSIIPGLEWALDILLEEGYRYDSSLFPVRRAGYGYPGAERFPYWLPRSDGELFEVPPSTLRWFGFNLPAGGGGYFRLLPYALTHKALQDAERRNKPATFYIHPWEIDPGQPHFDVSYLTRIRHYGGLAGNLARLKRLLAEFRFTTIEKTLNAASACR